MKISSGLPFDINITGTLTSEGIHIIQHNIVCIPNDHAKFIALEPKGNDFISKLYSQPYLHSNVSDIKIDLDVPVFILLAN